MLTFFCGVMAASAGRVVFHYKGLMLLPLEAVL